MVTDCSVLWHLEVSPARPKDSAAPSGLGLRCFPVGFMVYAFAHKKQPQNTCIDFSGENFQSARYKIHAGCPIWLTTKNFQASKELSHFSHLCGIRFLAPPKKTPQSTSGQFGGALATGFEHIGCNSLHQPTPNTWRFMTPPMPSHWLVHAKGLLVK